MQDITLEMTELLQWLEQVELQLFFSKPAWGHPDTTKETLAAHLVSIGAVLDPVAVGTSLSVPWGCTCAPNRPL